MTTRHFASIFVAISAMTINNLTAASCTDEKNKFSTEQQTMKITVCQPGYSISRFLKDVRRPQGLKNIEAFDADSQIKPPNRYLYLGKTYTIPQIFHIATVAYLEKNQEIVAAVAPSSPPTLTPPFVRAPEPVPAPQAETTPAPVIASSPFGMPTTEVQKFDAEKIPNAPSRLTRSPFTVLQDGDQLHVRSRRTVPLAKFLEGFADATADATKLMVVANGHMMDASKPEMAAGLAYIIPAELHEIVKEQARSKGVLQSWKAPPQRLATIQEMKKHAPPVETSQPTNELNPASRFSKFALVHDRAAKVLLLTVKEETRLATFLASVGRPIGGENVDNRMLFQTTNMERDKDIESGPDPVLKVGISYVIPAPWYDTLVKAAWYITVETASRPVAENVTAISAQAVQTPSTAKDVLAPKNSKADRDARISAIQKALPAGLQFKVWHNIDTDAVMIEASQRCDLDCLLVSFGIAPIDEIKARFGYEILEPGNRMFLPRSNDIKSAVIKKMGKAVVSEGGQPILAAPRTTSRNRSGQ